MSRHTGLTPEEIEERLFDSSDDEQSDNDEGSINLEEIHQGSEFGDSSEDDDDEIIIMQTPNLEVFTELPNLGVPSTPSTSRGPPIDPVNLFRDDLDAGPSVREPSSTYDVPVHHPGSSSDSDYLQSMDVDNQDEYLPPVRGKARGKARGGARGRGRPAGRRLHSIDELDVPVSSSQEDNPDSPAATQESVPPVRGRARGRGRPAGQRGRGCPRAAGAGPRQPRGGGQVRGGAPRGRGACGRGRRAPGTFDRADVPEE